MATAPDRLLLRLEWRVIRRLDGRLQGAYRTPYRGSGLDFAGLRGYVEEDDARHIDWNATARLDEPHVRQYLEDRELTVWLVLDRSASMTLGAPGRGKHEVLGELALILARLFGRGGNRIGALLYDGAGTRVVPPGTGRAHALRIGYSLERTAAAPAAGTTDFAAMLGAAASVARRRSLLIVISDFIGTGNWDKPLLRLTQRHDVVALRVVDAADDDLPEAGLIVVQDAETGEQLVVDSSDPLLRARLRDGVAERDAELTARVRRAGVPLHRIDTGLSLMPAATGWLPLGLLVVAGLVAGLVVVSARRRAALAAAGLSGTVGRRPLGVWLSIAGVAVLSVAVAGPAASVPVTRAAGTVIVAVDVSNSMSATDVAPTRLAAAKKAARAFVDAQPDSVDIGVVAFENGGLTTDQPSADHAAAAAAIDRLTVAGGTSLAAAILTCLSAITGKTVAVGRDGTVPDLGYWGSATIVLFSDGGDQGGDNGSAATEAAAEAAEKAGVHVETVGVGTTAGTTVDVDGYRIHTALDADTLQAIAKTSGGSYHPASDAGQLDGIAAGIDLRLSTHNEDLPLAGAFSAFAVLLLAVGAILTVLGSGRLV